MTFLIDKMYNILPPELWIKIVDYSGEINLLLVDTNFFELFNLVDAKIDVIEYIVRNNLTDILKYIVVLKTLKHPIINKNFVPTKSLNKLLIDNCEKRRLDIILSLIHI